MNNNVRNVLSIAIAYTKHCRACTKDPTSLIITFLAIADEDYTGLPSMFSFITAQSLSCIPINIIDDNIAENKEAVSLILQPLDSSPGVRISRGLSTVEIVDNDAGMPIII
jgi:hypothetical protein